MSLNRYEQGLFDYLGKWPEERRHWQAKVVAAGREAPDVAARGLERELWAYFAERAEHVPALRDLAGGSRQRVSMLNLAEHLLRLWGPVRPRKPSPPE